jgi:hypothetical protein
MMSWFGISLALSYCPDIICYFLQPMLYVGYAILHACEHLGDKRKPAHFESRAHSKSRENRPENSPVELQH